MPGFRLDVSGGVAVGVGEGLGVAVGDGVGVGGMEKIGVGLGDGVGVGVLTGGKCAFRNLITPSACDGHAFHE